MRPLFLTIFLLWSSYIFAQQYEINAGAESSGMGFSALSNKNVWAVFHNLSQVSRLNGVQIGVSTSLLYQQLGFQSSQLSIIYPLKDNAIGVGLHRFGDGLYNEQLITIGWSQLLGNVSIGIQSNLVQFHVREWINQLSYSFDASVSLPLSSFVEAQLLVKNFTFNTPKANLDSFIQSEFYSSIHFGLGLKPTDNIILQPKIAYRSDQQMFFNFGGEFQLSEAVIIRTGYSNKPSKYHFGWSIFLKKVNVAYALITHPFLKTSHQLSLSTSFSKLKF
ncbi:hypothetical protein [Sediminitomix flava]|uniref:Type IX secretion system PorP/SprF family membrane protein n=1 Tax=Sediminitomix flava TaxID=379075 RepID=A0A315ZCT4_SEDFL|nr:hypothetical protein [Sediminitomix flava]PWJ42564.1 hypothetical protein BC781_102107 [Sediminitomix flava]